MTIQFSWPVSSGLGALALALAALTPAAGADFYLAASARGSSDGSSAANAAPPAFFNSAAHWSSVPGTPRMISPGDKVHLLGNFAAPLEVRGSGRPGAPITIVFDPGASMIAPVWPSTGAIRIEGVDYIVVDGGARGMIGGLRGTRARANGIIRATGNGTALRHHSSSAGVYVTLASHIRIENLVIADIYRRTNPVDEYAGAGRTACVWITWTSGTQRDFVIDNCILHDAYAGVRFYYYLGSDYTVSHCTAYDCNWGASCGDGDPGASFAAVDVHDNYFFGWKPWDDPGRNAFHHNGFFCYAANAGSRVARLRVHANAFGPGYTATPMQHNYSTSALYISGAVLDAEVYNNLFFEAYADFPSDGLIYILPEASISSRCWVFNNTLRGGKAGIGINITPHGKGRAEHRIVVENNLFTSLGTFIGVFNSDSVNLTSDHNLVHGFARPGLEFSWSQTNSSRYRTPSEWRRLGFDSDLLTSDPRLDSGFAPTLASPARATGINLSGYFSSDFDGAPRPLSGRWDIGAFRHHAGPPPNGGEIPERPATKS